MSIPSPLYANVLEESLRPTRNAENRYFYQYTLRTVVGDLKAMMWNCVAGSGTDPSFMHKGDVVEIDNFDDQLDTRKSIVVHHFRRTDKGSLPDTQKSICEYPKADPKKIAKAWSIIADKNLYENEENRHFVAKCFSKLNKQKIENCPAASKIHHSMAGGLIIHLSEVVRIAKVIYECCREDYPFVSNDVLMASCALHDIGKVETYSVDENGMPEQMITEKMIGHMVYGIQLVQNVAKEVKLNQAFADEVCHAIAAHHGKVEFGNIKPIQSQEALILHVADLISSRNGMIDNKLQEFLRGNFVLPESFNIYSDPYFSSLGMQKYIKNRGEQ